MRDEASKNHCTLSLITRLFAGNVNSGIEAPASVADEILEACSFPCFRRSAGRAADL
jgi:hypothetical protein